MASSPSQAALSDGRELDDASRPLSGPGTSRHTRRLQLRNAKFQGPALPTRKVTPQSQTSSGHWSMTSEVQCSSDVENISPGGTGANPTIPDIREPSGALQHISNVSLTRRNRSKNRVSLGKLFAEDTSHPSTPLKYDSTSPEGQRASMLPRAVRLRTKNGHARQSLNTETRKYIEHLENELSTVQSQLSAATSPSATREQSSKLRTLNTETKHLQDEIADWEAKYEQRVEEATDGHRENESRLRSRLRVLEQEAEEAKSLMQELRGQLESTSQTLDATETANVNLEKRLEIMSEILATAPNKIDLHVDIPGRARQGRPKSMLPRFPTAGALIASPERQHAHPTSSPSLAHALPHTAAIDPLIQGPLSPVGFSSDAESYFSESSAGPSGIENPWGVSQGSSARSKPMRRMRRFGAGSFGPKPLILPSTSTYEQNPVSAPPLDRHDGESVFPFPPRRQLQNPEPEYHRPNIIENDSIAARMFDEPMLNVTSPSTNEEVDNTLLCAQSPRASSIKSGPDLSSMSPGAGRNLMDELEAIQGSDMASSEGAPSEHPRPHISTQLALAGDDTDDRTTHSLHFHDHYVSPHLSRHSATEYSPSALVVASHEWNLFHPRPNPPSLGIPLPPSNLLAHSTLDRLRILFFGDHAWHSPVSLARHLVHTAQARMRVPQPLLHVQWWLVGVLLGPMARRRFLGRDGPVGPRTTSDDNDDVGDDDHHLVLPISSPPAPVADDTLAYGTLYTTPPGSPGMFLSSPRIADDGGDSGNRVCPRSGSLVAGKGKKRVGAPRELEPDTAVAAVPFKHSPWLWLKFSLTLAFAVGVAFRDGPGSLLPRPVTATAAVQRRASRRGGVGTVGASDWRRARRDPMWVLTP